MAYAWFRRQSLPVSRSAKRPNPIASEGLIEQRTGKKGEHDVPFCHVPKPNGTTAGEKPEQSGCSERLYFHVSPPLPNCHNPNGNNAGAISRIQLSL
jgi:hypothetical protein